MQSCRAIGVRVNTITHSAAHKLEFLKMGGPRFGGLHNGDHSILGSILEAPTYGNPHITKAPSSEMMPVAVPAC